MGLSLNPSGSRAPRSPIGSSPRSSRQVVTAFGNFGATPAGRGVSVELPSVPFTGSQKRTVFGGGGAMTEPRILQLDAPVVFVNWYEAEAWCRWAKRRLPTEAEWEAAAIGERGAGGRYLADVKRVWPWGEAAPTRDRANLDFTFDAPLEVAACGGGDSAFGCRQMVGNVWEWMASDFAPFPDLVPTPTKTIRSRGLEDERCCAADAGRRAHGLPGPGIGTFFPPIAMTSFLGSGPAPFREFSNERSGGSCARSLPHGSAA